mgnify:FL=1
MSILLRPHRTTKLGHYQILVGLALPLLCLALTPTQLPDSYNWISQTTSEAAAQMLNGAWLARLGFLLFGISVLVLTLKTDRWSYTAYLCHWWFSTMMISTVAFSHKPWLADEPFDYFEDLLHFVTATLAGFAIAFGVVFQWWFRYRQSSLTKLFTLLSLFVVGTATFFPLLMLWLTQWDGLLQRGIFICAYVWYGHEAVKSNQS